jgi:O-antigen/teichoic acid export membrane protein
MTFRKQAASLAVMHAFEVLQPLLILPHAGRVLGPHNFGQYAYALSIGQFAATIVEYGFHWTAQRTAASARQEPNVIGTLFADVFAAKVLLLLVVTAAGLAVADGILAISKPMFMCVMLTAVGGILFPAWLFIGLERAWQAAIAVAVARSLALLCFLTMVRSPVQVDLAVVIQSAIPLVSGVISLPFILPVGLDGFRSLTPSRVRMQFRNGWRGFLFSFVERTSITLPVPLVEHFAGYVAAGQYSVAEKFVSATRPFFRVMTETLLPRVAYYAHHDPRAGLALIWRSLLTLGVGAALSLSLFFVAPYVIIIFFGDGFAAAIPIVRTMAVIPFLLNGNICMSNLYMFNYGHERAWSRLTVFGLLVFLTLAYLLSSNLANPAIGVAIAAAAKESVVFLVSAVFFLKFGATKEELSGAHGVVATRTTGKATGLVFPTPVPAVQTWRDQLRSNH